MLLTDSENWPAAVQWLHVGNELAVVNALPGVNWLPVVHQLRWRHVAICVPAGDGVVWRELVANCQLAACCKLVGCC